MGKAWEGQLFSMRCCPGSAGGSSVACGISWPHPGGGVQLESWQGRLHPPSHGTPLSLCVGIHYLVSRPKFFSAWSVVSQRTKAEAARPVKS